MSVGPGKELEILRREFEEFIKGLICLPIKLPGTRLYKSLKVKSSKNLNEKTCQQDNTLLSRFSS